MAKWASGGTAAVNVAIKRGEVILDGRSLHQVLLLAAQID